MSKNVLCIGALLLDELYFCDQAVQLHTSNPAQKSVSLGGVVANIAQYLAQLEVDVSLLTAFGTDSDAVFVQQKLDALYIPYTESISVDANTGKYISILNPDGSLQVAVCEDACTASITPDYLASKAAYFNQFEILVIDTNLSSETIQWCIDFCNSQHKKLFIEPVSVPKAQKLASLSLAGVFMITPNQDELFAILGNPAVLSPNQLLEQGVAQVWLRQGAKGSSVHTRSAVIEISAYPVSVVDSTGAGDAALAAWIYGHLTNENPTQCIKMGHALAAEVLQHKGAVVREMTPQKLHQLTQNSRYDS
ncbi:MAG: PfkB family carbohydrate kinase [Flavobacterium sp.]|nr:PfkB family carbohydrate kinase [Flavobacterium sp.]